MSKINLIYRAPVSDGSGYSVNSRNLLLELIKSNKFNIKLENLPQNLESILCTQIPLDAPSECEILLLWFDGDPIN